MKDSIFTTTTFKAFETSKEIIIDKSKYFIDTFKTNTKKIIPVKDIFLAILTDDEARKISKLIYAKQVPVNITKDKFKIDISSIIDSNYFEIPKTSNTIDIFEEFFCFCKDFLNDDNIPFVFCQLNLVNKWNSEKFQKLKREVKKITKPAFIENSAFKEVFESPKISMDILSRHFLVVGETGSGKTYSVLFPVIDSLKNKIGEYSTLIIDPKKNELKNRFINGLSSKVKNDYIFNILENNKKIDIFEGLRNEPLEKRIEFLFKFSPHFYEQSTNTKDSFWPNSAKAYIKSLIMIDEKIREKNKYDIFYFFDTIKKKLKRTCYNNHCIFPDFLSRDRFSAIKGSYFYKLKALSQWIEKIHITYRDTSTDVIECIQEKLYNNNLPQIEFFGIAPIDTFTSITSVSQVFFDDWTDQIIDSALWSNPFEILEDTISIEEAILNKKVLIFSIPPYNISDHHYRLGKIIKNKFFSFCFKTCTIREKNNIPVFYIADEFHRFITGDEESGEQNFLDRCRDYNISCIMATQSISSLKYGINDNTGFSDKNLDNSVDIVLNNCCTKFFFRTTDTETNSKLKSLIPSVPNPEFSNYGHVIDVSPVSSLNTGECYFITSKGKWGKSKINIISPEPKIIKKRKIKSMAA